MTPSKGSAAQELPEGENIESLRGSPGSDPENSGLMHSVLEHDNNEINDAKLLADSFDYNLNSFQPDIIFENIVSNYRSAKKLYGKTLIRELTGYDDEFVEKNINIPEFKEELKRKITNTINELRKKKLIDDQGEVTEKGIQLSASIRYFEELERLSTKGFGKEELREFSHYGDWYDNETFVKSRHRFKDIDLRRSLKKAIKRGHKRVYYEDLVASRKKQKGSLSIVYAIDSSGSMRGSKLRMAKRAGVALAAKALNDQNTVGLIVFTSKIENALPPSDNIHEIMKCLTVVRAGLETDIALAIEESVNMFNNEKGDRHLVLLTDALPTKSRENKGPRRRVLEAASMARSSGITISLVGVGLDSDGEYLAKRIVEIGNGKLYIISDLDNIDTIILEDYNSLKKRL